MEDSLPLSEAQAIAESFIGAVPWEDRIGFRRCPFEAGHSKRSTNRDLKVVAAKVGKLPPGFYCWHSSCQDEFDDLNFEYRRALGKREPSRIAPVRGRAIARPPKALYDPAKLLQFAAKLGEPVTREWLAARSPIHPEVITPARYLQTITRPGDQMIVFDEFESQGQAIFKNCGELLDDRALDAFATGCWGAWFLINPSDCIYRPNDAGHRSRRSWQNIVAWPNLLIESDKAPIGPWNTMMVQLPLPILSMCESGGDSIHSIVRIDAADQADWRAQVAEIKQALITLGADEGAFKSVQLARLPNCVRGQYGTMQRLLYLDPNPTGQPIAERKAA